MQVLQQASAYFRYFDKDLNSTINREEFKALYTDLVKAQFDKQDFGEMLGRLGYQPRWKRTVQRVH